MKAIESYWKGAVEVCLMVPSGNIFCNSVSDFPSTNYAKYSSAYFTTASPAGAASQMLIKALPRHAVTHIRDPVKTEQAI